ncbi:gliding motility lipoprotein GldD [Aquirufa sp. ROCK2-A2]
MNVKTIIYACLIALMTSCGESNEQSSDLPRPKGYNKIVLPKPSYMPLEKGHPFSFEVSRYATVLPDTVSWAEPHWLYVYYPKWQAFIQLTYKPLNGDKKKLFEHINDAYTLVAKHNMKSSGNKELQMRLPSGKIVTLIELSGEVATSMQFFTTDSTKHFLRGAVYVKTATQNDSLAPIIDFIKRDALHLVKTLEWK